MKLKKLLCLALALVCAFCFAVPVFAESGSEILIDQYQDQLADGTSVIVSVYQTRTVGRASGSSAHRESSHRRKASQFSGVASNIGSGCHSVRLENMPLSSDKKPGSVSIRVLNRTASSVRTRYLWVVCPVFSCGI